jgi:hypothetical protein
VGRHDHAELADVGDHQAGPSRRRLVRAVQPGSRFLFSPPTAAKRPTVTRAPFAGSGPYERCSLFRMRLARLSTVGLAKSSIMSHHHHGHHLHHDHDNHAVDLPPALDTAVPDEELNPADLSRRSMLRGARISCVPRDRTWPRRSGSRQASHLNAGGSGLPSSHS